MEKSWFKSLTFYGAVCLFIAGGLEAVGVGGALEIVKQVAAVFGLPLTGFGLRKAMK